MSRSWQSRVKIPFHQVRLVNVEHVLHPYPYRLPVQDHFPIESHHCTDDRCSAPPASPHPSMTVVILSSNSTVRRIGAPKEGQKQRDLHALPCCFQTSFIATILYLATHDLITD
jgi:hypothetical protein